MRVGRIAQMTERQRWFNLRAVGLQAASSYKCFGCLLVLEDMYQIDPHLLVGTWPEKHLATGNRYKSHWHSRMPNQLPDLPALRHSTSFHAKSGTVEDDRVLTGRFRTCQFNVHIFRIDFLVKEKRLLAHAAFPQRAARNSCL